MSPEGQDAAFQQLDLKVLYRDMHLAHLTCASGIHTGRALPIFDPAPPPPMKSYYLQCVQHKWGTTFTLLLGGLKTMQNINKIGFAFTLH